MKPPKFIQRWVHRNDLEAVTTELVREYVKDNTWYAGYSDGPGGSVFYPDYPSYEELVRWIERKNHPERKYA